MTTDSEMVERVARAIAYSYALDPDGPFTIGEGVRIIPHWKRFAVQARAAIEAMREPTPAMCNAYCALEAAEGTADGPISEDAWHAMIDAALRPNPHDTSRT